MLPVATISVAKYLIFDALFFHPCICQTRCKCIFRVFAGSLMYSAFRITISSWSQMCEKKKKNKEFSSYRFRFVLTTLLLLCVKSIAWRHAGVGKKSRPKIFEVLCNRRYCCTKNNLYIFILPELYVKKDPRPPFIFVNTPFIQWKQDRNMIKLQNTTKQRKEKKPDS